MPPLSFEARKALFWSKVIKTRSCWLWTGPITQYGHGTFDWPGVAWTAHRIAWILTNGPILPGFTVCHSCPNRHCVRPSHLHLGTQADNNRDPNRFARGTAKLTNWRKRLPIEERFWKNVKKGAANACWIWQRLLNKDGYGMATLKSKPIGAHRLAWILTHGEIPDGLYVLHNCPGPDGDNRACVNPAHLWLGTAADNARDCLQKGRHPVSWNTKLTPDLRQQIVTLDQTGTYAQHEIATLLGLSQTTIARILKQSPGYVPRRAIGKRLTTTEREEICRLYRTKAYSQQQLADQFGVTQTQIWRVLHQDDASSSTPGQQPCVL